MKYTSSILATIFALIAGLSQITIWEQRSTIATYKETALLWQETAETWEATARKLADVVGVDLGNGERNRGNNNG